MKARTAVSSAPQPAALLFTASTAPLMAFTVISLLWLPQTLASPAGKRSQQQISLNAVLGGSPGAVYHALSSQWAQVNVRLLSANSNHQQRLVPLGIVGVVVAPEASIKLTYDPDTDSLTAAEGLVQKRIGGSKPLTIGECPLANTSLGERAVYTAGRKGRSFSVELPGVTIALTRDWIQQIRAYSTHLDVFLNPYDPCSVPLHGLLVMMEEPDEYTGVKARDRDDPANSYLTEGALADYEEAGLFSTSSQFSLTGYEPSAE
eukprot:TRINITY_DN29229_c0_g1_i1.p1 TRINITY_DN29229_c0_g1~~TRINITY_DN29229_c0_g1_i1.p1  ORF type:complete len:262 (+),score=32.10 TRINITY_DN29229_c0_g1_i1:33-818(+)